MAASPAKFREIGDLAVWSVTSAKAENGVDLLRDGKPDTYWQSDGTQPHLINIQFQRRIILTEIHFYFDYRLDESYTPNRISIRAGTNFQDLKEIKLLDTDEPTGWVVVELPQNPPMKAFLVQVAILANHQNGRDTHVRQVRIFGPRKDVVKSIGYMTDFTSSEFTRYAVAR